MEGIKILELQQNDVNIFIQLIEVFAEVFEMEDFERPPSEYLQTLLKKKGFMVFVAMKEDNVVGGLTVYTLDQYYSEKPLAYIYDLAVLVEYQRKGIGRKLVDAVCSACKKLGYHEVFVQADEPDDYALDFYRLTNPTAEEPVRHFYYTL